MTHTTYLPRIADAMFTDELHTSDAVQIVGPKWCGKTVNSEHCSASQVYLHNPDTGPSPLALADAKPSAILNGAEPQLIDEWQMAPQLWDAVRFSINRYHRRLY